MHEGHERIRKDVRTYEHKASLHQTQAKAKHVHVGARTQGISAPDTSASEAHRYVRTSHRANKGHDKKDDEGHEHTMYERKSGSGTAALLASIASGRRGLRGRRATTAATYGHDG